MALSIQYLRDLGLITRSGHIRIAKVVLELKIRYGKLESTIAEGLEQAWFYMDRANTDDGHLVIFEVQQDLRGLTAVGHSFRVT